jgi:DNA-binding transcriptional LysR family regulator
MELRHLRYFVAVGEEQHYGRAAQRLHLAQPALSRQIQDLEREIGFQLFERLPRGVRLSAAGKAFLDDAHSILRQVGAATNRAGRVARGLAGTLRVGFPESASWHGVVPDSFRRFRQEHPDAELQLSPMSSLDQVQAVRGGSLDAGFVFNMSKADPELDQLLAASEYLVLAAPRRHPLASRRRLRLRDLTGADFIWFPRRQSPLYYDRLIRACARGGLSPRIMQEAVDQATILSLVVCGMGIAFVSEATRWRCPRDVVLRRVVDLSLGIDFSLVWRRDDASPLLAGLVAGVRANPQGRFARPDQAWRSNAR